MGSLCTFPAEEKLKSSQAKSINENFTLEKKNFVHIKPGKIRDDYILCDKIEDREFATTFNCKQKSTGSKFIAKIYNTKSPDERVQSSFLEEAEMLRKADHPNIINVVDIYQDESSAAIVTECWNGGELLDRIHECGKFSEYQAALYVKQIALGLAYLHSLGFVHRDIRPDVCAFLSRENDFCLKIVDFAVLMRTEKNLKTLDVVGNPFYRSPESTTGDYSSKSDVWSLGVIMHILLTGKHPFTSKSRQSINFNISSTDLTFKHKSWQKISTPAKDLLQKLLQKAPESRISIQTLLEDAWIHSNTNSSLPDSKTISATMEKLRNFGTKTKLQKAILSFIVSQQMSSNEVLVLKEVFQKIDKNGDGLLSHQEILEALREFPKWSDEDIERMVKKVDLDGNGQVSYSEFLTAAVDWEKEMSKKRLEEAFRKLDTDQSGKISKEELMTVFAGSDGMSECFDEMIREVDKNGDGEIDLEEFYSFMSNLRNKESWVNRPGIWNCPVIL